MPVRNLRRSYAYIPHITATSVTYNIEVRLSNHEKPDELGVCWSTEASPSVSTADHMIADGQVSIYTFVIENLTPGTHYYVNGFFKYDSIYYYILTQITTPTE